MGRHCEAVKTKTEISEMGLIEIRYILSAILLLMEV